MNNDENYTIDGTYDYFRHYGERIEQIDSLIAGYHVSVITYRYKDVIKDFIMVEGRVSEMFDIGREE